MHTGERAKGRTKRTQEAEKRNMLETKRIAAFLIEV